MTFIRNQIDARVLNDLKNRSAIGIVFYIILAAIVIGSDKFYLNNPQLSRFFFASVSVICFIRFLHILVFKRFEAAHARLNLLLFQTTVALTALVWGVAFAVFMTIEGEFNAKLLIAICTAGLNAGGVVAFLPARRMAIIFNGLMMLPAGTTMIILQINRPLAIMIFLFFAYMALICKRGSGEYWDALENEAKLQEKSEILKKLSRTDGLTGLYNRGYFDEVLQSEWKRANRDQSTLTIVLGDIDQFKKVNDEHGHVAGDEYLKFVAKKLKNSYQRQSDLVARYGGEEFVILLPDTSARHALELTEKVRMEIENGSIEHEGVRIKTTVSFGIASIIPDYKDLTTSLVSKADDALYKAKLEGRNRIVISDSQ